jgi:hypothetical protein
MESASSTITAQLRILYKILTEILCDEPGDYGSVPRPCNLLTSYISWHDGSNFIDSLHRSFVGYCLSGTNLFYLTFMQIILSLL